MWDFALAAALVVLLNFFLWKLPDRIVDTGVMSQSHRFVRASLPRLSATEPLDLVLLGDSRLRQFDVAPLCEALIGEQGRCFNAASTSGSWVTVHDLFGHLGTRIDEETVVVVGVSDYWLEMGGRHGIGILPRSLAYLELGDPATALASFIPLSVVRGTIRAGVHAALKRRGRELARWIALRTHRAEELESPAEHRKEIPAEAPAAPSSKPKRNQPAWLLRQSSVDHWYAEGSEEDRAHHMRHGRRALTRMSEVSRNVVLLYVPNPRSRERYVDDRYPGRRARFFAALEQLGRELDLPVINLSGRIEGDRFYNDFHHLNERGVRAATELIVTALRRTLVAPDSGRQPRAR